MARILLVDDQPGGARAAVEKVARAAKAGEIERVESAPAALARLDAQPYDFVLLPPEGLRTALAGGLRSGGDVLRETFDVFEDGVCLVAPDGTLEVANTTGTRLYDGGLRPDLQAALTALEGHAKEG